MAKAITNLTGARLIIEADQLTGYTDGANLTGTWAGQSSRGSAVADTATKNGTPADPSKIKYVIGVNGHPAVRLLGGASALKVLMSPSSTRSLHFFFYGLASAGGWVLDNARTGRPFLTADKLQSDGAVHLYEFIYSDNPNTLTVKKDGVTIGTYDRGGESDGYGVLGSAEFPLFVCSSWNEYAAQATADIYVLGAFETEKTGAERDAIVNGIVTKYSEQYTPDPIEPDPDTPAITDTNGARFIFEPGLVAGYEDGEPLESGAAQVGSFVLDDSTRNNGVSDEDAIVYNTYVDNGHPSMLIGTSGYRGFFPTLTATTNKDLHFFIRYRKWEGADPGFLLDSVIFNGIRMLTALPAINDYNFHIIEAKFDTTAQTRTILVDGVQVATGAFSAASFASIASQMLTIGGTADSYAGVCFGYYSVIAVYGVLKSSADAQAIRDGINTKFATAGGNTAPLPYAGDTGVLTPADNAKIFKPGRWFVDTSAHTTTTINTGQMLVFKTPDLAGVGGTFWLRFAESWGSVRNRPVIAYQIDNGTVQRVYAAAHIPVAVSAGSHMVTVWLEGRNQDSGLSGVLVFQGVSLPTGTVLQDLPSSVTGKDLIETIGTSIVEGVRSRGFALNQYGEEAHDHWPNRLASALGCLPVVMGFGGLQVDGGTARFPYVLDTNPYTPAKQPRAVVSDLSTNDLSLTQQQATDKFTALFQTIRSGRPNATIIQLLMPRTSESAALVAGIQAAAAAVNDPRLHIIDVRTSSGAPSLDAPDGTHLSIAGATTLTNYIATPIQQYIASDAALSPPTVSTQPANQTVTEGATATFTATFAGAQSARAQKLINSVWTDQTGAAFDTQTGIVTLVKASTQSGDAGSYRFIGTNTLGNATTNTVTLTVNPVPVEVTGVSIDPAGPVEVETGGTQQFNATVTGTGNFNPAKIWSKVSGSGNISSTGLYTAPSGSSTSPRQGVFKCASVADPTKNALVTVTIPASSAGPDPDPQPVAVPDIEMGTGYDTVKVRLTEGNGPLRLVYFTDSPISEGAAVQLTLSGGGGNLLTYTGEVLYGHRGLVGAVVDVVPDAGDYSASWEVANIDYPLGYPITVIIARSLESVTV